uniref:Uncharacterized protein n=1 Tax=Coccidioides posadasii RMSCC 3488 TaxID=454284 RepID=A0A0J6FUF8_COCPO|nr:hypothetical protein CPAG_09324 [Coccidioides posadasii RMSCC 3488]
MDAEVTHFPESLRAQDDDDGRFHLYVSKRDELLERYNKAEMNQFISIAISESTQIDKCVAPLTQVSRCWGRDTRCFANDAAHWSKSEVPTGPHFKGYLLILHGLACLLPQGFILPMKKSASREAPDRPWPTMDLCNRNNVYPSSQHRGHVKMQV